MSEVTIFTIVVCIFLVVFLVLMNAIKKELKTYVQIMCGTTTDKAVDEFFKKSVIIAIDSYKNKKCEEDEMTKLIIERASGIVSDVLLQHKISPKDYNLEGLCKVQLYKLGFLRHRKVGDING